VCTEFRGYRLNPRDPRSIDGDTNHPAKDAKATTTGREKGINQNPESIPGVVMKLFCLSMSLCATVVIIISHYLQVSDDLQELNMKAEVLTGQRMIGVECY
jgi:hypothetical protein